MSHSTSGREVLPRSPEGTAEERSKRTWYRLDQTLGISRSDLVNSGASIIFGAIIGWAITALFSTPARVGLWIDVSLGIIALSVCLAVTSFLTAFQREGRERLELITSSVDSLQAVVTESIEGSAVLVPRESIYFEMARSIREATEQVVICTYFMYDWKNDQRTFAPTVVGGVPGVDEFYEAVYSCIVHPEVEYLRLWQVPAEHVKGARAKIMQEERLAKEFELIESISPDHPELCRVRIIPESTTASIILVDRKTLFFNIDFFDIDRGLWLSPFMLMIKDARGRAFADMKRVIAKLTS